VADEGHVTNAVGRLVGHDRNICHQAVKAGIET
jgi:hypothetical protein